MASAAGFKHPEYSGRMTHQIAAVQGAARENTSHFSTLQPKTGRWEVGVMALHSGGRFTYYCVNHIGLHHHLVAKGQNAFTFFNF